MLEKLSVRHIYPFPLSSLVWLISIFISICSSWIRCFYFWAERKNKQINTKHRPTRLHQKINFPFCIGFLSRQKKKQQHWCKNRFFCLFVVVIHAQSGEKDVGNFRQCRIKNNHNNSKNSLSVCIAAIKTE